MRQVIARMVRHVAGSAALLAALLVAPGARAGTLDEVKARGYLRCGVGESFPGFFSADSQGRWRGLDVDFCRALAAAILNDAEKVRFLPATPVARFAQLQSGEVDLLSRSVTWTLARDAGLGLQFAGVTFFDGQGVLVRRALGITGVAGLAGGTICTQTGTTTERNLADYFAARRLPFRPLVFETADQAVAAYEAQRCDAYTTDKSTLAARMGRMADPAAHEVLPETMTFAANGPVVRQGDAQWFNVVAWTRNALVAAEERGITAANADAQRAASTDPQARRLLGADGDLGRMLGLEVGWAGQAIRQVGNYGEMYERNLGPASGMSIVRTAGPNRLARDGGLLFSPSFE